MSDYLEPVRGDWVTFHPTKPGPAEIGQVAAVLEPNQWGRLRYRVEFWTERKTGKRTVVERADDTVSADRLISITRPPRDMKPLITSADAAA